MKKMDEEKFIKVYKVIMLIAITAFITFLVTSVGVSNYYMSGKSANVYVLDSTETDGVTTTISAVQSIIDRYYMGEQNKQKMAEGAIKGYVAALGDPYTEYVTVSEMEEYTAQLLGNYVGIGIYMIENKEHNMTQILAPIVGSPAYQAGILPGDLIKTINGVEYSAEDITAAANEIKGEEGTKVSLTIIRDGKELQYEITRRSIATNPINCEILENKIGYMGVASFDKNTGEEFKEKFEALKEQKIKGLIIDLRNNGGGLVSESLEIADYIVPKGETLLITVNKDGKEKVTKAQEAPIVDIPVVVLTNENSASASEILAGALKDLNKATIVGTKTYGKGVIQQFLTLTDGSGLKLTIEEYFTPNKNKINKVGIEPHEAVELPESVKNPLLVEREQDTQLNRAIEILKNK